MLSCKDVTEQTSDFLEKQSPLYKRIQMKLHLLMCHHCRRYLRQMGTTIGIIKQHPQAISDEKAKEIVDKIIKP